MADTTSFEELIEGRSEAVRETAGQLRDLMKAWLPDAVEKVSLGWNSVRYRINADLTGIQPLKDRCNVYFMRGTELDDLLEGTGKGMRHAKVPLLEVFSADAIERLVRAAVALDAS